MSDDTQREVEFKLHPMSECYPMSECQLKNSTRRIISQQLLNKKMCMLLIPVPPLLGATIKKHALMSTGMPTAALFVLVKIGFNVVTDTTKINY